MKISKEEYSQMTKKASPNSPLVKDCIKAFLVGGLICLIGQALTLTYNLILKMEIKDSRTLTSVTLVFLGALLTSLGVYDNIAKHGGAGTLVPITGFANAMVSPAIEFKTEGFVLGTGAKLFTIAGPVLVFGITAGAIYGLILWIASIL
ncbi:MAG: stage V sporulation protein AC [Clostridiales bacterium]|nr:stage V sporulation protein AC [Clostridiales bacterium]